ncbi:MAG: S24 family peptidase [Pseudomonadota bacterium]
MDELDLKAYYVEDHSALKSGSLQNVIAGRMPSLEKASAICDALGLELYLGPPRPTGDELFVDPATAGLEMIRRYDVEASAGAGHAVLSPAELEPLAFRRDWLVKRGITPANAVLITARGSSMEPIISDGDLVMVDTARTTIPIVERATSKRRLMYWVIRQGDDLRVKDIERSATDTFHIISENIAEYRPEIIQVDAGTDFEVIGRVIWWGHTVPI